MVKLDRSEIKDILPVNLISPEVLSISHAFAKAQRTMQESAQALHLYAQIEQVPESILDLLALEMGTQYYGQTMPRKTKERLVMQTLVWYMHAGTPSVLNEFLETVLEGGCTKEWYAYGGEPYYFRAYALTGNHEIPLGYGTETKRCIETYKNVRSWLEYLMFVTDGEFYVPVDYRSSVIFGGEFYPCGNVRIKLDGKWKLDGRQTLSHHGDRLSHYPSKLIMRTCLNAGADMIPSGNGLSLQMKTEQEIKGGSRLEIMGEAGGGMDYLPKLAIGGETDVIIQPGEHVRITVINKLNHTWKMDGTKKLNGGLYLQ